MNILYLTQFFSSSRGGGSLIFYNFAKTMAKKNNNIHIICNLSTEKEDYNIFIHKVKPYLKEANQLPQSIRQHLQYIINSITTGIKIIDKYNVQIIHTNSLIAVIAGSILGKIKNVPVIATVHDIFAGDESGGWKKWAELNRLPRYYSIIGTIIEKMSLSMPTDAIHTVSNATCQDIYKLKPKAKVKIIYPSIDTEALLSNDDIKYNNFIIFIGRLVFYKNVEVLLKAFRLVIEEISDAQLIIIGDGPMKETWKKMTADYKIDKNVFFVGNISHSDKINYLSKCSALALPSIFEGFGLVILESFAMRKPVLVSDVKPFNEIVDNELDGFLISYNNPKEWAEKIKTLLADKNLSKTMGEKGMSKAFDKFNFIKSMDKMESLYREIARKTI